MEMLVWSSLVIVSKLFFYVGFASALGSYAFRYTETRHGLIASGNTRWTIVSLLMSCVGVVFWFLSSTGAMAEAGIAGILDPFMLDIMWTSPIGEVAVLRFTTLLALLALTAIRIYFLGDAAERHSHRIDLLIKLLVSICFMLLAYSFTLAGHVAELNWVAKSLVCLHVLVMAWWFGSLPLLRHACRSQPSSNLQGLMEKFGIQAMCLVPLLLAAGLGLSYLLLGSISELISTAYGQVLLAKIISVVAVLAIAANHKFRLVPLISSLDGGREKIEKSIGIEMAVAMLILILCAVLTSVVGPLE